MISVRVFSATGELLGNVVLDIRKSSAGFRLQQALFVKGSGVVPADLERLDTNALPLSTLSKVYSAAELRSAIVRNTDALRKSAAEADARLAVIETENLWDKSQLRKSRARPGDEPAEVLGEYGYRDVSGKGQHYAHRAGHTCSVKRDGSWSHSTAPDRVMTGREADGLKRFLARVHGAI